MKKITHAKIILISATVLSFNNSSGQNISRVSCSQICERLTPPANSTNDAASRCDMNGPKPSAEKVYKPQNDELQNLMKANSAPNAETQQRTENAKQLSTQMQKDNVQNMTNAQKEEYARKNLAGKEGMPSQATMDFAEKMKDPSFKEKFQNMSTDEKVAYMKNNVVVPQQPSNAVSRDPNVQKTESAFAKKMQDPAFRSEWNKKSKEEQNAYMKQMMQDNNVDMNKLAIESKAEGAKTPDKPVLSEVMPVSLKTFQDANAFMNQHEVNMLKIQAESKAKHEVINAEAKNQLKSLPQIKGGEGAYPDPKKVKPIMAATMQKHMAQAEQDLKTLMEVWNSDRINFDNLIRNFDVELQKINYGDDVKLPAEKMQLNSISSYQSSIITNLFQFLSESQSITENAADWVNKNRLFEQGNYVPVTDSY